MLKKRLVYISLILLVNVVGFFYYYNYLMAHGYLPGPFINNKSNTFMDWFNVLYGAYDNGRYTDNTYFYPPLSFLFLKVVNFVAAGVVQGTAEFMRDNSPIVIAVLCLLYLAMPAVMLATKLWHDFSRNERVLIYFVIILSTPLLFALERGNLILVAPLLLLLALSKNKKTKSVGIALLINLKPYFVLLLIYYVARKDWRGFVVCALFAALILLITGMMLDSHFYLFATNLLNLSRDAASFPVRDALALPSSISAFSYVLLHPYGAKFAAYVLSPNLIVATAYCIEIIKWSAISISFASLYKRSGLMLDVEIFALLVVVISNLGISVGGYTFILYIALIPVFMKMQYKWVYIGLITLIALPLDIVPLLSDRSTTIQYSYLAGVNVETLWTLGLGSVIRPIANLLLLLTLSYEFLMRKTESQLRSS